MPKAKQKLTGEVTTVEIETPKNLPPRRKVLRDDLQSRVSARENEGWNFLIQVPGSKVIAQFGENELQSESIESLLDQIDGTSTIEGKYSPETFDRENKKAETSESFLEDKIQERLGNVVVAYETNLLNIVPSSFEGQKRRREKFTDEEISELADSIVQQGVLEPILVRVKNIGEYEIIAGERRWLAAKKAGLKTISTIIKNVSDQVAFEIQTIENLQRKEPDPLDEAFSYREYIEKYGMTEDDLAVKFGKPLKFIAGRLAFNNLIPEALDDIAKGYLPLGHAAVLAKYAPEIQKEILEEYTYEFNKEDGAVPLYTFKENIQDGVTLELSEAIFDKEVHNLRPDGLACVECPQRTGFKPTLFVDDLDDNDRCLNKDCFNLKTTVHMNLRRQEIAQTRLVNITNQPIEEFAKNVLLVAEYYHYGETEFGTEKVITYANLREEGSCEHLTPALVVDSKRKGETAFICQNKKCPVHNSNISSGASGEPSEWELKRNEENFNREIDLAVQNTVAKKASERYDSFEKLLDLPGFSRTLLLNYLQNTSSAIFEKTRNVFRDIPNFPKNFWSSEQAKNKEFLDSLDDSQIAQILFVSAFAGDLQYGSWGEIKHDFIAALAENHTDFNLELLKAEKRLELAPKQFKPKAKEYLDALKKGESVEKPYFWIDLNVVTEIDDENDFDENSDVFDYEGNDVTDILDETDISETND